MSNKRVSIKLPFNISHVVQAIVAVLSSVGAIGTQILQDTNGILPDGVAAAVSSLLTVIAAIAGFLKKAEPVIDDINGL